MTMLDKDLDIDALMEAGSGKDRTKENTGNPDTNIAPRRRVSFRE